jgi:hypothetical protein
MAELKRVTAARASHVPQRTTAVVHVPQVNRHCFIKAKGAVTMHQSCEEVAQLTLENYNKPDICTPLHGSWAGKWITTGEPIA